jgi:hypothetical protein
MVTDQMLCVDQVSLVSAPSFRHRSGFVSISASALALAASASAIGGREPKPRVRVAVLGLLRRCGWGRPVTFHCHASKRLLATV